MDDKRTDSISQGCEGLHEKNSSGASFTSTANVISSHFYGVKGYKDPLQFKYEQLSQALESIILKVVAWRRP